jgi:hypothetical protein
MRRATPKSSAPAGRSASPNSPATPTQAPDGDRIRYYVPLFHVQIYLILRRPRRGRLEGRTLSIYIPLAARPSVVGELARGLPVSRPAVSQHLCLLKAPGLRSFMVDRVHYVCADSAKSDLF